MRENQEPELPPLQEDNDAEILRELAFQAEAGAIRCKSAWGKAQLLGVASGMFAALDDLGSDFVLIDGSEEG